ncbi:hypothetical protein EJ06DRAFT_512586 [Trichodelitschia bisporula]|uniref:Sorting nexin MVP1 n=1 Tax=Trichodelitschia bisporula TaxID=703511 RepID=A0A6G1HRF5_9PEZI|nr:hypothetical protein EJ06DRAFT_512586 [Trichodelitschia bisporula]
MSLFGDFPDDGPAQQSATLFAVDQPRSRSAGLFDDERPAPNRTSSGGLFDDSTEGADPWALPSSKRVGRGALVKTLLPASDVPPSYAQAFEAVNEHGTVGFDVAQRLVDESGLPSGTQQTIMGILRPEGGESSHKLERGEFNVLLALIGLAQEGEEATLDSVDDHRRNLPRPNLSIFPTDLAPREPSPEPVPARPATPPKRPETTTSATSPVAPRTVRQTSFGLPENDPWASPDMHRGHTHSASVPYVNGASMASAPNLPIRTTSAFTTAASPAANAPARPPSSGEPGWGGYPASSNESFRGSSLEGRGAGSFAERPGGFGGPGGSEPSTRAPPVPRSLGGEEVIAVTSIAEKEGLLFFQHRNYLVASARRNSRVVRRYSDFVWLLDCLHKRYPFRQLPLLPPKAVTINGNYLATDNSFAEKRRRGLVRFTNALVRHPVLGQEQLVVMFLTVPTELAVWRKQATISVQEEFTGKPLPPGLEDSLPPTLQDVFEQVRVGVRRSAELYITLCNLLERLTKRNEGLAAEHMRFAAALGALAETSNDTYAVASDDVPALNAGLGAAARHLGQAKALLEDEARAWDEGVLEDCKRQRDCLVSVRDMFDRRDRLDRDNIPQLEKRIASAEARLQVLRERPEVGKEGEAQKVADGIIRDKGSIAAQHARSVFIRECIRDELAFFMGSQYHVGRLHQDWAAERVKYAELQADNWRGLADEVEGMPTGE